MEENNLENEYINEENKEEVENTYIEPQVQDEEKEKKKKLRKNKGEKEEFSLKKEIFSWIKIFIIAVVIAFVVNNCIIMNANVPSGSMMNTILKGDRMIGL